MEHDAFDTETEWFDSRRAIAESSKMVGRMSDSEFFNAIDRSKGSVVLGDYAGLAKTILLHSAQLKISAQLKF